MAGRVPDDRAGEFAQDTFVLNTHGLSQKYDIAESTARDWRLDCKRRLNLEVGYGTGGSTVEQPVIVGVTADNDKDPEALWETAFAFQEATEEKVRKRNCQSIELPNEPCGIAFLSDMHFGSAETDYRSARRDAEIVKQTEGLYCGYHGDGFDNWIVGKLTALQRDQALTGDHELQLFLHYLDYLSGKLLWNISGNHDNWTYMLAGVDIVREATKNTMALYDPDEVVVDLKVGPSVWAIKARHKWKYSSIFNPTHAQEVGWQRGDVDFDIALGGHTHVGTYCRPFHRHGKKRFAVLTGTYKVDDKYGRRLGFASPQGLGSGAMLFHPDGRTMWVEDLETAADFLTYWRQ